MPTKSSHVQNSSDNWKCWELTRTLTKDIQQNQRPSGGEFLWVCKFFEPIRTQNGRLAPLTQKQRLEGQHPRQYVIMCIKNGLVKNLQKLFSNQEFKRLLRRGFRWACNFLQLIETQNGRQGCLYFELTFRLRLGIGVESWILKLESPWRRFLMFRVSQWKP